MRPTSHAYARPPRTADRTSRNDERAASTGRLRRRADPLQEGTHDILRTH